MEDERRPHVQFFASKKVKHEEKTDIRKRLLDVIFAEKIYSRTSEICNCLLYHQSEIIRKTAIMVCNNLPSSQNSAMQISKILRKCIFEFEKNEYSEGILQREQCSFCGCSALLIVINMTEDIDGNENRCQIKRAENEMDILKTLESKDINVNVARLLAFNPCIPKFYIKERLLGDNLQKRLLNARENKDKIPTNKLMGIIIQAIGAIIYVHGCGILLRDITTVSFGCSVVGNRYEIKLKNFEHAANADQFGIGGIIDGLTDLDFDGVPTRWAAPEALLGGHYSIYTDVWSANILMDEILNYAAWPYSDVIDTDIGSLVKNIVFTHLKPQGFNRPRRVQGLLLEGLAFKPSERLKLEALRERLIDIVRGVEDGDDDGYSSFYGFDGSQATEYDIPPLTKQQIHAKSKFERGIPASLERFRSEDEDPYETFAQTLTEDNISTKVQIDVTESGISSDENYKIQSIESEGDKLKVIETVSDGFLKYTFQRLKEIETKIQLKVKTVDGKKKLIYLLPRASSLLDITLRKERNTAILPYMEILYEVALHIDSFHSSGWIFRCLRARNIWILENKDNQQSIKVPKFGDYRPMDSDMDSHFEQLKVVDSIEKQYMHWLPIESLKANLYSKESDVYAFGMVTWEVMTAYGQEGVIYDKDEEVELSCVPFANQKSENV